MILISNLTLNIKDGSTIASTSIYGTDKKTYINIGSGNVFKLEWETPKLTDEDDTVDHYSLVIKRYDPTLNIYYDIFSKNIGLVNEFYVDSPLLPIAPDQYLLSIYLVAYGKHGDVVTSNVINPYISKGSGSYVKVNSADYAEPIMKRALAFVKAIDEPDETPTELADINGEILLDAAGNELFAHATKLLNNQDGWKVTQEIYTKGQDDEWHTNDIKYEVLIAGGESNYYGEPIEVIVGTDAKGNNIYEPLYVL